MNKLELDEIMEMQPEPASHRLRRRRHWLAENWLAVVMFLAWVLTQLWTGGSWVFARQHNDDELAEQLHQLRAELNAAGQTYVRQDVWSTWSTAVLARLDSIDRKLDRR